MKKVLIADDSLFMRTVIKDMLGGRYRVAEADSGRSCLETFDREKPDVVLLDVVMPEGDEEGLRVLREIKTRRPEAKVIMITALGQHDAVVAECLKRGAQGCVRKPFEEKDVLKMVEESLR